MDKQLAFFTMESVRKGKGLTEEMEKAMIDNNIPDWFIDSCKKIKYMFPKAHAVAYIGDGAAHRILQVHYPKEYYATYFTTKYSDFDASYVLSGPQRVQEDR